MSTVTYGPPVRIAGPFPVTRPYRLLDVANVIPDVDPHWQIGGEVYPYPIGPPELMEACASGTFRDKTVSEAVPLPRFGSFAVYLAERCTSRGLGSDEAFKDRALAGFNAMVSFGIEEQFSQGTALPDNPFLADGNGDILNGGAAALPIEALGRLEEAIGATAEGGVIHATPAIATVWAANHLLYISGTRLLTHLGTPVVVGTGYEGAQPVGQAAPDTEQMWAFATGPVDVRRSGAFIVPDTLAEATDRFGDLPNTVTYYVEEMFLVDWDTVLQAAQLVDLYA